MMSKNAPTRVQKLQRQAEALQLRIEGKTYDEIATILGISRATTFRYVAAGVSDLRMDVGKRKEELRNLQAARLESLVLALWPKVKSGDVKAVSVVVNVLARTARLYGLDEPSRVEAQVKSSGSLDLSTLSENELKEHCRRLGIPVDEDRPPEARP